MKEKKQQESSFQGFHPLRELIEERKAGTLPMYGKVEKEKTSQEQTAPIEKRSIRSIIKDFGVDISEKNLYDEEVESAEF